MVVPIHLATTFAQESPGRHRGFEYSRSGNPTRANLEECLASLEGAAHGLAFASGLAATTTVMLLLDPGDHVVFTEDVYGGTFRLFDKVFRRYGLTFTSVDPTDPDAVAAAMTDRTRLVWLESPTNPLLRIVDIDALSELVHGAGALVAVDSTFASPVLQRPLELGADLVIHSSTKFLGGHSDVLGGAVLTSDDALAERMRFHQNAVGAVPSPFDCWLLLRGLKTLQLRVLRQCESALVIARWLEGQDAVAQVYYPGLESNPGHAARPASDGRPLRRRGVLRSFVGRRSAFVSRTVACVHARRVTGGCGIARRKPGDDDPRVDTGGDPYTGRRQRRAAAPVRRY